MSPEKKKAVNSSTYAFTDAINSQLLKKLKKNENANAPAKLCDLFGDAKELEGMHYAYI
jgi:hypothetical protein